MSRFLPLVVLVIWMSSPATGAAGGIAPGSGAAIFLGVYVLLVMVAALLARQVARGLHFDQVQRRLRRFNAIIYASRLAIPAWFAAGVLLLGWKGLVMDGLGRVGLERWPIKTPGLLAGTLPAFLAWMGLWWAQYPADRALREQNVLAQLHGSLPTHLPASFWAYFFVNLRLQLLFALAPAVVLVGLHDVLTMVLPPVLQRLTSIGDRQDLVEAAIRLPTLVLFLVFSPEILRRVLHTEPMPDCPLRQRLERIAGQQRMRFRDVLLWKTRYQMGNAAVMGFLPRFRYVLLSDLLLETMSDEQIEAIFAHEIGHVRHRHLFWIIAAMAALMMAMAGPGQIAADGLTALQRHVWLPDALQMALLLGAGLGLFSLVFGYVSRKFERQADVFAARTLQSAYDGAGQAEAAVIDPGGPRVECKGRWHVGRYGADIFCTALERVAVVNNIPIAARSWCHGSIAKRMRFVAELGGDPARTAQFDRFMSRMYAGLIVALAVFAGWMILSSSGK